MVPVTAIASAPRSHERDRLALYVGQGNELVTYHEGSPQDGAGTESMCSRIRVFGGHSIHGITIFEHSSEKYSIIVHGDKSVTVCEQMMSAGAGSPTVRCQLQRLDDLVLATCLLPKSPRTVEAQGESVLVVGYAHNFLDILLLSTDSDGSTAAITHFQRIHSTENACMFSMTLRQSPFTANAVQIVSGSAMGDILLWSTTLSTSDTHCLADNEPLNVSHVTTDFSWVAHEGVVFRSVWATGGSPTMDMVDVDFLASVSDDRSVRLWKISMKRDSSKSNKSDKSDPRIQYAAEQIFIGWGHISRVWDVCFVGQQLVTPKAHPHHAVLLATASEDGSVKLWKVAADSRFEFSEQASSCCLHTFKGHHGDVWRLASIGNSILSGGNDAAIKRWDLSPWCSSSRDFSDPSAATKESSHNIRCVESIPQWPLETTESHPSFNSAVSGILLSPDANWLLVTLADGCVWLVECTTVKEDVSNRAKKMHWQWYALTKTTAKISNASVEWVRVSEDDSSIDAVLALAHPRGLVTLLVISTQLQCVRWQKEWQAHKLNTVSVWMYLAPHQSGLGVKLRLVSCSVKGSCRVWEIYVDTTSTAVDKAEAGQIDVKTSLLLDAITGGKVHEIATAAAIIGTTISEEILLAGDIRGSISVFYYDPRVSSKTEGGAESDLLMTDDQQPTKPSQFLHRVHDGEPIGSLRPLACTTPAFTSGGNDGTIVSYISQKNSLGAKNHFCVASIVSALPLRSPQILMQLPTLKSEYSTKLYTAGYYGGSFIVNDFHHSQQLLNVDGGSWKRRSTCSLLVPSQYTSQEDLVQPGVLFISAVPTTVAVPSTEPKEKGTVAAAKNTHLEYCIIPAICSPCLGRALLQASESHLGRVAYAAVYVGKYLAIAGEEGRILLLAPEECLEQSGYNAGICDFSDTATIGPGSRRRRIAQETNLESYLSVKGLCSSGPVSWDGSTASRVLVGCGSRLAYSVWICNDEEPNLPLRLLATGSVWPNASQDHRILCSAITVTPKTSSTQQCFLTLCDSRGKVSVGLLPLHEGSRDTNGDSFATVAPHRLTLPQVQFAGQNGGLIDVNGSSPIRCCKMLSFPSAIVPSSIMLGVFGATNGEVSIYAIYTSALFASTNENEQSACPNETGYSLLATLRSHTMGANAVDAVLLSEESVGVNTAPGASVFRLVICSAGDDQALTVVSGMLQVLPRKDGLTVDITWSSDVHLKRYECAASASFQGVHFTHIHQAKSNDGENFVDTIDMISLSADQRLHLWGVELLNCEICDKKPSEIRVSSCASAYQDCSSSAEEVEQPGFRLRWLDGRVGVVGDPQALAFQRHNDGVMTVAVAGQGAEEFALLDCVNTSKAAGLKEILS